MWVDFERMDFDSIPVFYYILCTGIQQINSLCSKNKFQNYLVNVKVILIAIDVW